MDVLSLWSSFPISLLSPHKHRIQFVQRNLEPGRSPVIALPEAFGLFHLAQQRVHLGDAHGSVGAHCGMVRRSLTSLFEQLADLRVQFDQVSVYRFPDDSQVNREVAMRDAIAHGVND